MTQPTAIAIARTDFEMLRTMERGLVASLFSLGYQTMETLLDEIPLQPADFSDEPTRRLFEWLHGRFKTTADLSMVQMLLDLERENPTVYKHAKLLVDGYVYADLDNLRTFGQRVKNEGVIRGMRSEVPSILNSQDNALKARDMVYEYMEARTSPFERSVIPVASIAEVGKSLHDHLLSTAPIDIYDFGIESIQDEIVDFTRGNMGLLGGTPGTGKTSLIVQSILRNVSHGRRVGFITLEMTALQLSARMLSRMTGIPGSDLLRRKNLTPERIALVLKANKQLGEQPFFLNIEHDASLGRVLALMRMMVMKHGVEVIYLDYVQRLSVEGSKGDPRIAMSMAADELARFAAKHNVALLVASQFKRLQGREPQLDDFRESGALEANASFAIGLWLDLDMTKKVHAGLNAEDDEDEEKTLAQMMKDVNMYPDRVLKFIMLKQRNHSTFENYVMFTPAKMKFADPGEDKMRELDKVVNIRAATPRPKSKGDRF